MNRLNYIVNYIIKHCKFNINDDDIIVNIKDQLDVFYPDVYYTKELINNILLLPKDDLKKRYYFETLEEREEYYEEYAKTKKISKINQNKWNQYIKLRNIPQPVQKSKEWFDARNNMITASAAADILHLNKYKGKYGPECFLIDKLGYSKFLENENVFHGKKYESVATMIYEHIYNVKIGEFGLIPHFNYEFLGASPDGIATNLTLDYNESQKVGRMLEIKCPNRREIKTSGIENKDICPIYYWVQVQLQLECCDLEECDFWQCNILEYDNIEEWLSNTDNFEEKYTEEQNINIEFDNKYKMGMIVQFLPISELELPKDQKIEWYGKYIYPPGLDYSIDEYKKWTEYIIEKYSKTNLKIEDKEYKFDKIL